MGNWRDTNAESTSMSMAASIWLAPSMAPPLQLGETHIWRADLDLLAAQGDLGDALGNDEQERAARFVFARDRGRFVAARGLLRLLLAGYTNSSPAMLRFGYGPHGKPFLQDVAIEFNVSHSHQRVLIAVRYAGQIGIDIERVRTNIDYAPIAADLFSEREYAELCTLPEAHRRAAFFACWVRKEAFVKACGLGLALPLKQFDVSLRPGEPAALLRIANDQPDRWSLYAIDTDTEYTTAVVIEGNTTELRLFDAII
ncbi:MAG: 4'-phosphopantetheinyl transferase superfamily protein [Roseiflexaceae bacterium]|nr:4'-phosphopantetheinyl transferase superfamily protein [Roseiflexaceae bacterium]